MKDDEEASASVHVKARMVCIVVVQVENEVIDKQSNKVDGAVDAIARRHCVTL